MKNLIWIILIVFLITGCQQKAVKQEKIKIANNLIMVGNYSGMIQCADCPGINMVLELNADSTYMLEETYLNADKTPKNKLYSLGKWIAVNDGIITLKSGKEENWLFGAVSSDKLVLLDKQSKEIKQDTNFFIKRTDKGISQTTGFEMTGLYSYIANAGLFTECNTGITYPVAGEEDNSNLETEYLKIKKDSLEKIFVKVNGHFKIIPKAIGRGNEKFMVVSKLIGFDRESKCK